MKLRDRDEPLDPRVERDLDAVDRALGGQAVDPDLAELAELTALLADERPEPAPGWSEELDRRVAARAFAPRAAASPGCASGSRACGRCAMLAPAGALATLAVIAVVGASTLETGGATTRRQLATRRAGDQPAAASSADQGGAAESSAALPDAAGYPTAPRCAPHRRSRRTLRPASREAQDKIAPGTAEPQGRARRHARRSRPSPTTCARPPTRRSRSPARSTASSPPRRSARPGGTARATLELTIPTRNLDAAIDRLTDARQRRAR